jgi:hypothetical protein
MLPGESKTSAFTIVVQVARADYSSRVCLSSRDDEFQLPFRVTLVGRRSIALSRDATPVYQFLFQVGEISPAEIAPLRNSIRCRFRHAIFYLVESPLHGRGVEYWVTRWGVSYLELHGGLLPVSPLELVWPLRLAEASLQAHPHPGSRLRPRLQRCPSQRL